MAFKLGVNTIEYSYNLNFYEDDLTCMGRNLMLKIKKPCAWNQKPHTMAFEKCGLKPKKKNEKNKNLIGLIEYSLRQGVW